MPVEKFYEKTSCLYGRRLSKTARGFSFIIRLFLPAFSFLYVLPLRPLRVFSLSPTVSFPVPHSPFRSVPRLFFPPSANFLIEKALYDTRKSAFYRYVSYSSIGLFSVETLHVVRIFPHFVVLFQIDVLVQFLDLPLLLPS